MICPVCLGHGEVEMEPPNIPRYPDLVQKRHERIVELREKGLFLKQIALAVGLRNHTTISHHIEKHYRRRCRCFTGGT